jgi:hypothetical protein
MERQYFDWYVLQLSRGSMLNQRLCIFADRIFGLLLGHTKQLSDVDGIERSPHILAVLDPTRQDYVTTPKELDQYSCPRHDVFAESGISQHRSVDDLEEDPSSNCFVQ